MDKISSLNLESGIYFLQLHHKGQLLLTKKIIKE